MGTSLIEAIDSLQDVFLEAGAHRHQQEEARKIGCRGGDCWASDALARIDEGKMATSRMWQQTLR